ncbi:MAG: azurin [Bacteroidia bacterium]|nr:azurin [Bacteroidia bacterium]NNM22274.1 azurin [Flavobacteriaceae bacterium]
MRVINYVLFVASLSLIVACGDKKEEKKEDKSVKIGNTDNQKKSDSNTVSLGLTGNDLMQYDKSEFKVKAGQEVTLTLRHVGKMELLVMGHNFVLLKPGTNIQDFAVAAATIGKDADWIPDGGKDVIVHTKMIGGGQSTSITFTAPEAGEYDFVCSFPGHSALMKGKFIVE